MLFISSAVLIKLLYFNMFSNKILLFAYFIILISLPAESVPRHWNDFKGKEKLAARDFLLSIRGLNGTLQSTALHPYLKNLLVRLGTNQNGEGLLEGVSSEDCKGQLIQWSKRFFPIKLDLIGEDEKWALHLLDSWSHIPEGVLTGHINPMGDFHECVQIKAKNIKMLEEADSHISRNFEGRYCTTLLLDYETSMSMIPESNSQEIKIFNKTIQNWREIDLQEALSLLEFLKVLFQPNPKALFAIFPSIGGCFPNSCSLLDVQHVLVNIVKDLYANLELPPQLPPESLPWPVTAACYDEKKPDFDAAAIIMICILSAVAALCLASGVYDCTFKRKQESTIIQYFLAFSFYTNTKKWMSTKKGAEDFGCLHGIRFLSTAWVIIGHTFEAFLTVPTWNFIELQNIWKRWPIMVLLNGTYSVDTFFVLSGALATYSILKLLQRTNGKLNLIMFYIHRYLRLTPAYAIQIGIVATLMIHLGSGPFFMNVEGYQESCRKNWWTNLLYINNLYKLNEMCAGQTWYLSNDMQFYVLSPFIVYPIWKKEIVGLVLLAVYTILSCISPVLLVHFQDQSPAMVMTGNIVPFNDIYFRPWARISTFLVGVWLGWILYKTRNKQIKFPRIVIGGLWLCSTVATFAVIFAIHPYFNPDKTMPKVAGYFYAAFSRFTWGIVISWIVFACIKGYGGPVNKLLSWKVFMPLGRLSYCVYLTSLQLQNLYHTRSTQAPRFDIFTIVHTYFGHLLMCHCVGFIFMLMFESPFIILQKLIFEGPRKKS